MAARDAHGARGGGGRGHAKTVNGHDHGREIVVGPQEARTVSAAPQRSGRGVAEVEVLTEPTLKGLHAAGQRSFRCAESEVVAVRHQGPGKYGPRLAANDAAEAIEEGTDLGRVGEDRFASNGVTVHVIEASAGQLTRCSGHESASSSAPRIP